MAIFLLKLAKNWPKNAQNWPPFFWPTKWPFLEINWPIIDPKLFKIGLLFLPRKNGRFFFSKLAKNWPKSCSKFASMFLALKMAISLNKLAPFIQNWPKNDPKWFKFCLKKISSFQGINWPKIDPENFKIRRRSDSTFGLAQLAHNMAKTGWSSSRKCAWLLLQMKAHETQFNSKGWNSRLQR